MSTPAQQLTGMKLTDGWSVEKVAPRKPNATGGYFSCGYVVVHEKDGRRGFLKALDYHKALEVPNAPEMLQGMTNAYVFEKELCRKCAHLRRIARAIGSGSINPKPNDPFSRVDYLIFELADRDVRAQLDLIEVLDLIFVMTTLHNVAVALSQLHQAEIAHQDLKPSNVLVFASEGSKICDLGRAWDRNAPGPCDGYTVAGDRTYAPPELAYGELPADERSRRFGCDIYHLGNLIVFMFARANISALWIDALEPDLRPWTWGGSYDEVLPFVQAAFDQALTTFATEVPEFLRADLERAVGELCNPDHRRRGVPWQRGASQHGLERYVALFDRLRHKAKLQLTSGRK